MDRPRKAYTAIPIFSSGLPGGKKDVRVAKCNTHGQNDELRNTIRHFDSPAGGLLNAKGAQGRPFHTFPAKFLRIFPDYCYFATAPS